MRPCKQTCDSPGPHNPAKIVNAMSMAVSWLPTIRSGGSWDNLYCWWELGPQQPTQVTIDWAVNFDSPASLGATNCVEFEFDLQRNGLRFNGGWQFCFGTEKWRVFNISLGQWVDVGISGGKSDFIPGRDTFLTTQYQIGYDGVEFQWISVNGTQFETAFVSPAFPKPGADHFNVAYQFDSLNKGQPIQAHIDGYTVTTF